MKTFAAGVLLGLGFFLAVSGVRFARIVYQTSPAIRYRSKL